MELLDHMAIRLHCRSPRFHSWVGKMPWRRDRLPTPVLLGCPYGSVGKESAYNAGEPGFAPWVGEIPWRRERLPTLVFWPGEFHGLYSPEGRKESDTTERVLLSLSNLLHVELRSLHLQTTGHKRQRQCCSRPRVMQSTHCSFARSEPLNKEQLIPRDYHSVPIL